MCEVHVNGRLVSRIGKGILVFAGITHTDTEKDALWLSNKIVNCRIFPDDSGKMALSVKDVNGELMIVSQMTIYGSLRKGLRPAFNDVAPPSYACQLYELLIKECEKLLPQQVKTGIFGEMMDIHLINDGPVTFILDTHKEF